MVISETVYSSASHGAIYNAASRIIIDGGRKALHTAALGGMMMQNLTMPLYAGDSSGVTVSFGRTSTVSAGETWTSTRVSGFYNSIAILNVYGTTIGTNIRYRGGENIFSGGTANSTVINGEYIGQYIYSGGVAIGTTIISGASQYVAVGGVAIGTTIDYRGLQDVARGGIASGTAINSGGWQHVASGGIASGTAINSGGIQYVSSGGVASRTTIYSGGIQYVSSGGVAIGTTIDSGGWQDVSSGGSAIGTVQSSGGNVIVTVYGGDTSTVVSGTNESGTFSLSNGIASGFILYSGGWQYVSSGGVASRTTINSGGRQYVSAGGYAINNIINSGALQTVNLGGVVSNTVVGSGGSQIISSGGSAGGMIISGTQYVSAGAVDTSATIVYGGVQYILNSGIASNATVNSWGYQIVSSGGLANSTTVNSGGHLDVRSGGSATNVIQHSGGWLYFDIVSGDTTYITGINERGSSFSLINGVASNVIINGKGVYVRDGGILYNYIATSNAADFPVRGGGSAINVIQESGGAVSVDVGTGYSGEGSNDPKAEYIGKTYITGTNQYGQSFSLISGVASNFVINSNGDLDIYSGGKAYGTIINSGSIKDGMTVHSGGSAISTTVKSGGSQLIEDGGYAIYTTVSSGGTQTVESGGMAISNYILSGAIQNIENGAIVENAVISSGGSQIISSGGNTSNMTISGGVQYVSAGATDISATILSGGQQHILSDGIANNATVNSWSYQIVSSGGLANSTTVNSGGKLSVRSGGSATNVIQHSGGQLGFDIVSGDTTYITGINERGSSFSLINGVASNVINNGKGVWVHDGGILYNYIATSNGDFPIGAGGSGINVIQETGGDVCAEVGTGYGEKGEYIGTTYITGTNQYGQNFSLISGVASNFVINEYDYLDIYSGGKAYGTIINSGHSGGKEEPGMTVHSGGSAISTTVKSGGSQLIEDGGYAIYTTVSSGGKQTVESGGMAISNFIYAGGIQNVEPGAIVQNAVISGGGANSSSVSIQEVSSGGIVSNTSIGAGGIQQINSGGSAISARISSGGGQNILSGGTASGTVIYSGGTQNIRSGGSAAGTEISRGGIMNLSFGGIAADLNVKGGGMAVIYGSNALSGDNVLSSGGLISLSRVNSATPAVLAVDNLAASNGTVAMNLDFAEPGKSDKIVIHGTHTGNAIISIKTVKGGEPVKDDSLKLVEYSGGAFANGTFSLKGGKWDTGWYEYTLGRGYSEGNGNDYYLRSTGEMTPIAKTTMAAPEMANAAVNVALNSLQKRLGDLRNMGDGNAQHGTWARGYYQGLTLKDKVETEMKVSGIEAGYDFRLSGTGSSGGEGTYLGFMAGSTSISGIKEKGKAEQQKIKGSGSGFLGGAYLTYIGSSGFFADFTFRGGTNKLDMSAYTVELSKWLDFSENRTFVAASAEIGKSFGANNSSGWKIEPKAEIQYKNVGAAEAEIESIGEKIKFGNASYITGTGTLGISYSWKDKKGLITEPYAEVSYSQELSGEETVEYYGHKEKTDMKGSSMEGRIGLNMQLSESLYWHAAASFESGSKREGFGADAGIRYMFGENGGSRGYKTKTVPENLYKKESIAAENKSAENISAAAESPADVIISAENIAPALPKAVNAEPGNPITEHISEAYLKKAQKAKETGAKDGVLAIPSMGILFKTGSDEILEYYHPMLDAFAELYKQTDGSAGIFIEGYSSDGGKETEKNPGLSKQRGLAAAYYLMKKGIPGNKITVKPYRNSKLGEGLFKGDPGYKGGQCYRRVNISIK